ncbi:MAG: hypothetical protein JNL73_06215 [Anaerolineales bacterium]|nr:hypothetical protein [Anaerolineales bacterium]
MASAITGLQTLSQILASGIVITSFSLLLYALTFNLRERVARAFAVLTALVTAVYFCDVMVGTLGDAEAVLLWLRLQWIGIAFVPAAFLHFSDAVLASTGRPSRGRRRLAIRVLYGAALVFWLLVMFTDTVVGAAEDLPVPHLTAQAGFWAFLGQGALAIGWAAWNFWRAHGRAQTATTRRRMRYLIAAAAAPLVGTFPFILVVGQEATLHALTFWVLVIISNLVVSALLLAMAYTVAYYGVTLPDRVVKGRFFQWFLRGPVVASSVLAVYVVVNRFGPGLPFYDQRVLPFLLIGSLLLLQFFITLVRLPIERRFFYGAGRDELRRLVTLEDRLLTTQDLRQFFESVLANLSDSLGVPGAFLIAYDESGRVAYEVVVGALRPETTLPPLEQLRAVPLTVRGALAERGAPAGEAGDAADRLVFVWGASWLVPLHGSDTNARPLGLLGVATVNEPADAIALSVEERDNLQRLVSRAATALEDRRLQQEVFEALDRLLPEMETVQRMRASAYADTRNLEPAPFDGGQDLPQLVRDALRDYAIGPRLTQSPLVRLRVVEQAMVDHEGNATQALRSVLREAIERIRPEGQRKTTGEWLLYNILEMKFLQGQKVRDVALRLAVSEADFYRKQRLALEEAAGAIAQMEREARAELSASVERGQGEPPEGRLV